MNPPATIETTRLRLRVPRMEDAPTLFESYTQDPEVTKYVTWSPHKTVEETRSFLKIILDRGQSGHRFPYVIIRKEDDQFLGMLELRLDGFKADFGYVLAKAYWGKGYTAEAVQPLVDWALAQKDIFRVWAICDVENLASARVMEKVGMKREGILRRQILHPNAGGEPRDVYSYSIVK